MRPSRTLPAVALLLGVIVLILAVVNDGGVRAVRPHLDEGEQVADHGQPAALAVRGAESEGTPLPGAQASPADPRLVAVEVTAEDERTIGVDLYASDSSGHYRHLGRAETGQVLEFEVGRDAQRLIAVPRRDSASFFEYENGSAPITTSGSVRIVVQRATGTVVLRAEMRGGHEVPGITMGLRGHGVDWQKSSRRLTDDCGEIRWMDVRRDVLRRDAIVVLGLPEGVVVVEGAQLLASPGPSEGLYEARMQLAFCESHVRFNLGECLSPDLVLERKTDTGWTRNLISGRIVSLTDNTGAAVRGRALPYEEASVREMTATAETLCTGEYRFTLIDAFSGVRQATFSVDGKSDAYVERLKAVPMREVLGQLSGAARGVATRLVLVIGEASGSSQSLQSLSIVLPVASDGSFRSALPADVNAFTIRSTSSDRGRFFVCPSTFEASTDQGPLSISSVASAVGNFLVRDARGQPVAGAELVAHMLSPCASSEEATMIGRGVTDQTGRLTIRSGGEGTWAVDVRLPSAAKPHRAEVDIVSGGEEVEIVLGKSGVSK